MPPAKSARANNIGSPLGFEAKLWLATDKLRNNMDAAEYKHVVLGLIFHKYISDSFEDQRAKLVAGEGDYAGANPEDPDEYRTENIFWVPKESRWSFLQANAKQPTIGKIVDDAMVAIERDNLRLKGVLPKDGGQPSGARQTAKGSPQRERGGVHQFYTPSCVVRCLVEMLAPYKGRIYDPACGSGGRFVQSGKFVESHGGSGQRDSASSKSEATLPGLKGNRGDSSIYGQDKWARRQQAKQSNATTRRSAVMNLALRGIEADFGPERFGIPVSSQMRIRAFKKQTTQPL
jgi:type I restriction enzyme M protein